MRNTDACGLYNYLHKWESPTTSSPPGFSSFVVDSAICGYHVYKDIWPSPVAEEQLQCEQEVGNSHDPMSVTIKKLIGGASTIIGHVPRRISPLCSVFIRRGGSITRIVDGTRRYSADLLQGGLELLCKLMFIAPNLYWSARRWKNWFDLH